MRTAELGDTGLEITRVGFGAWAIGGGEWEFGWGAQDDDDSIAAIHRALERGVNCVDTAPAYGGGHSEEVVGRALDGRRRDVTLGSDRDLPIVYEDDAVIVLDKPAGVLAVPLERRGDARSRASRCPCR